MGIPLRVISVSTESNIKAIEILRDTVVDEEPHAVVL